MSGGLRHTVTAVPDPGRTTDAAISVSRQQAAASSSVALAGLAWTLVRTDFKARYHGTISGFLWALLKPMCMFLVLMGVFSFLFTDPRYKLHLIIGLILWDFFAEATKTGLTSLHAKSFLLTKIRCPLWVLVVSSIANALITLSVFVAIIMLFLIVSGQSPGAAAFALFMVYCVVLVVIVVGFSLAASV